MSSLLGGEVGYNRSNLGRLLQSNLLGVWYFSAWSVAYYTWGWRPGKPHRSAKHGGYPQAHLVGVGL